MQTNLVKSRLKLRAAVTVASFALLPLSGVFSAAYASPLLSRVETLLAATPEGGWVQLNTNIYSDAWATGSIAVDYPSYSNPAAIVRAWSSTAWDSTRGDLLLWGGGHANYAGNEMYVWNAQSGEWARGSVSSRVDKSTTNNYVVDNAAPQSAHTYDNNLYLPVNDMFLTFGGAAFQSGGNFAVSDGSRAGPWLWDPNKADPNKVGGTTGSGYDPNSIGGDMWTNRQGSWSGSEPGGYINSTTAYRTENGKDVVYVTSDPQSSGFPSLYRYTVGDVRNGGADRWEKIGTAMNSVGWQGAATIDTKHNLYIRTAEVRGPYTSSLMVWDLSKADPANPDNNRDIGISLILEDGTPFVMNRNYGVEYDQINNRVLLWDGADDGTVWSITPGFDANGNMLMTWVDKKLPSTTPSQPDGNFVTGVLGKWDYISELGAFIALNEFSTVDMDAEVWLYKPFSTSIIEPPPGGGGTVPEPNAVILLLTSLGLLGVAGRRRHQRRG